MQCAITDGSDVEGDWLSVSADGTIWKEETAA
jgi:hypothetical protein